MDDISDISWDPLLNSGKIDTSFLRRSSKTFVKIPWHRKRPPTTLFFASPDASSDLPFGLSSDISQFRKRSKTDEFAIPFNFSYTFNEDCVTRANSLIFLSSSSSSLSSDSEEKVADSALLQSQSFDSGRTLPSSVSNLSQDSLSLDEMVLFSDLFSINYHRHHIIFSREYETLSSLFLSLQLSIISCLFLLLYLNLDHSVRNSIVPLGKNSV